MTSLALNTKISSSLDLPDPLPEVSPGLPIFWKGSIHYEAARINRVFNHRRPLRFPLAVIEAKHSIHILEAVRLANTLNCRISIRSGGHSWAAWSVRNNSILIDLGKYFEFSYDEETEIAKVSPSMTGRMLNSFLAGKGRMFPGGHCPDVGIGGFLLQGGMGWNCKNWGWACEKIVGIDVVTADGKQFHCNEKENRDLFFAARGAGPGFPAIVTRFNLRTIPKPSNMRSSAYFYEKKDYRKALSWIIQLSPTFDPDTEIVAVANYPQGSDDIQIMVLLVTFKNDEMDARGALQPAHNTAPDGYINSWFMKPTSLNGEYDDQACANPEGHRYCAENAYIDNDDDIVRVLEPAFTILPSRKSFSLWYSMAPGSQRKGMPDMALSMQSDHYFAVYSIWEDEKDDRKCQSWVQSIMKDVEKHSVGSYLGDADFQIRKTKFWGHEQGTRLMQIRRDWDPKGIICGYLDEGDRSGIKGLKNAFGWETDKEKL